MSIRIELATEIEADLAALAAETGVPLDLYLRSVLEQHALPATIRPESIGRTGKRFRGLGAFPYRRTEPLPDEAITRESLSERTNLTNNLRWTFWWTQMCSCAASIG